MILILGTRDLSAYVEAMRNDSEADTASVKSFSTIKSSTSSGSAGTSANSDCIVINVPTSPNKRPPPQPKALQNVNASLYSTHAA